MSYVITIEHPAGKSPLTPQDFAQFVKNDEYLSKTNDCVLMWKHPNIGQDFYITIETNHLWADGVTRDKADEFVETLRQEAGRLDARIYGEEGKDITQSEPYVQSHTMDTPLNEGLRTSRGMLPQYDGLAEVWFESEEALMEEMSSPEGLKLGAALLEDEGNFIDHSKSTSFIVEEHEF